MEDCIFFLRIVLIELFKVIFKFFAVVWFDFHIVSLVYLLFVPFCLNLRPPFPCLVFLLPLLLVLLPIVSLSFSFIYLFMKVYFKLLSY